MGRLEITTVVGCPIRCKYCPQNTLIEAYEGPRVMSYETFVACLNKVPKDIRIDFSGFVEPWLNKQTSRMLKYADEQGYRTGVNTTLFFCSAEDVDLLAQTSLEELTVHVPDVEGNTTWNSDGRYIERLSRLVDKALFHSHGRVADEIAKAVPVEYMNGGLNNRAGNLMLPQLPRRQVAGPLRCQASGDQLDHNVLLPDGRVVLCAMDYGMRHVLGNLLTQAYEEILEGPAHRELTDALNNGQDLLCRSCSLAIPFSTTP